MQYDFISTKFKPAKLSDTLSWGGKLQDEADVAAPRQWFSEAGDLPSR